MSEALVPTEERQDAPGTLVSIDPRAVAIAKQNLKVFEDLVTNVLESGIDYGITPGTQGPGLWDAGAGTIMDAFNVYSDPSIISQTDEGGQITLYVKTELRHRVTRQVVATGVGAASGMETKYAYRWMGEKEAAQAGVPKELLQTLKTRTHDGKDGPFTQYRVKNPDPGELVNTIFKMAVKRSEIDAAQALPGAKKALAKLFGRKEVKVTYRDFFGETRRLGFTEKQAHDILGVKSLKDWEASGKTLDEAIAKLREARQRSTPKSTAPAPPSAASPVQPKAQDVVPTIKTPQELLDWVKNVGHDASEIRPALGLNPKDPLGQTPQEAAYALAVVWGLTMPDESAEDDPFA